MAEKDDQVTIFFLGIGGTGMRGLAHLMQATGHSISGTDDHAVSIKDDPSLAEYELVEPRKAAAALRRADAVVYSDAVPSDHPLLAAAAQAGIPVTSYPDQVGRLAVAYKTVAVTGTHGKSSTTAFLAHILVEAGFDPTVLLGASVPAWEGRNARAGAGDVFVVEADEYRDHFLTLHPAHAIITSIEYDHPDFFRSLDHLRRSYNRFLRQVRKGGSVVVSQRVREENPMIDWPAHTIAVPPPTGRPLRLSLPGEHMQHNARLAIAMAQQLGIPHTQAVQAAQGFAGLGRRMEPIGSVGGCPVFSDYGHHPTELAATLQAARQTLSADRIAVLFEPHMIERLQQFSSDYAAALQAAANVVIAPVFQPAGRQYSRSSARHLRRQLQKEIQSAGLEASLVDDAAALPAILRRLASAAQAIIVFSAGALDQQVRHAVQQGRHGN